MGDFGSVFIFLRYKSGENSLEIIPSGLGSPSIKDKDILIFCISQLMHRKNRGEEIGKRVRFSARELMMATNRNTDGREYKRVEKAFQRLQGTQFKTSIRTGGKKEVRIFSLIDEGGYVMREEGEWRLDYCEVVLSDWFMRAIEANEVVSAFLRTISVSADRSNVASMRLLVNTAVARSAGTSIYPSSKTRQAATLH
ncbi:replication initiator protein A [Sulfitobacter sp. 1A13421]|uniref:replication initiator protein A n=1 Tax=Sulfitobacter sp. 1A13421 TaxID=3368595 RepID=UPI00374A61E6